MSNFSIPITVRFEHCDPAGIVFYPRYFQFINYVVEVWFERGLHVPFYELHYERHLGIPARHISCEFILPSRLDDVLTFKLRVIKLGKSSATLDIRAFFEDEERLRAEMIIVFVYNEDKDGNITSIPIPEDIRQKMLEFT